jgi:hypothetical protein
MHRASFGLRQCVRDFHVLAIGIFIATGLQEGQGFLGDAGADFSIDHCDVPFFLLVL